MFSGTAKVLKLTAAKTTDYRVGMRQNRSNEDYCVISKIGNATLYFVFDGHGGGNAEGHLLDDDHCVLFLKDYLHHYLALALEGIPYSDEENIREAIYSTFYKVDNYLYGRGTHGCTCSGVIVTPENLIVVNLGDSRTLVYDESLKFETFDHKAVDEKERIVRCGGKVTGRRLNGIYLPSGSFGDFCCKEVQGIYSNDAPMRITPDITFLERSGKILVGSDGIFDAFKTSEDVVSFLKENGSSELIDYCLPRNFDDDIAYIVVEV